jgi:CubicO group peptidase (beta-lactamase class C family)
MKSKILKISIALIITLTLSNCKIYRFVAYNFSDITDYKIFPSNHIENNSNHFVYPNSKKSFPIDSIFYTTKKSTSKKSLYNFLSENEAVAFLVIKNDSILYENYFSNYEKESIVASFSMAKSVLSLLIGCAIDDGKIKSINEPITNYLPELKKEGFNKIKINDVLNMTSGIEFNESYYNPFGNAASVYYGTDLRKEISKLKITRKPSTKFKYSSGDSQILGLVLHASLKGQTISNYLQEKIWIPLGMEYDATWSLDKKNGVEKTFCCLNARARDFAKIGRLYLNEGNWNGKQIVSKEWIQNSLTPNTTSGDYENYKNQWWLNPDSGSYMAQGINGQYIYVNPNKKLIIVKLGKRNGNADWPKLFNFIANKIK